MIDAAVGVDLLENVGVEGEFRHLACTDFQSLGDGDYSQIFGQFPGLVFAEPCRSPLLLDYTVAGTVAETVAVVGVKEAPLEHLVYDTVDDAGFVVDDTALSSHRRSLFSF